MSMADDKLPARPDDLLGDLTRNLSEQEQTELRKLAAEKRLGLEEHAATARIDHEASQADMDRDLEALDRLQLDRDKHSYKLSGEYRGGSGRTELTVKNTTSTGEAVKWIAVALVILAVLVMIAG